MTFIHELLQRQELVAITNKKGRTYTTPIGPLESVTTVIGRSLDKKGLKKWRENIGENAADQILLQSQVRGREVHDLCERYVMNFSDWRNKAMPTNLETFQQFKPILDQSVETVYGLELPLWSKFLQTAGQADLVVQWNGKKAVVDYKTSRKRKTEEQCLGYMIQGTTYACMVMERYQIDIPLVVVIVAVDGEKTPTIYTVPTSKYFKQMEK